jgi:hypothetical protein
MVGSITSLPEASLLLLVPTAADKTQIKCAKNSLRYRKLGFADIDVNLPEHSNIAPSDVAVLSVSTIHSGVRVNITPDLAAISGKSLPNEFPTPYSNPAFA